MKLGIVSDTHGYFDPKLRELLNGVDSILHAGDVGSESVLDELRQIAPVQAVRGNVDDAVSGLPLSLDLRLGDLQIHIIHQLPVPQAELERSSGASLRKFNPNLFLKNFDPQTRIVIFGHTHKPCLVIAGQALFMNPGSCGRKRFSLPRCCGMLETSPQGIRGFIMNLEEQRAELPHGIWLPLQE